MSSSLQTNQTQPPIHTWPTMNQITNNEPTRPRMNQPNQIGTKHNLKFTPDQQWTNLTKNEPN